MIIVLVMVKKCRTQSLWMSVKDWRQDEHLYDEVVQNMEKKEPDHESEEYYIFACARHINL